MPETKAGRRHTGWKPSASVGIVDTYHFICPEATPHTPPLLLRTFSPLLWVNHPEGCLGVAVQRESGERGRAWKEGRAQSKEWQSWQIGEEQEQFWRGGVLPPVLQVISEGIAGAPGVS